MFETKEMNRIADDVRGKLVSGVFNLATIAKEIDVDKMTMYNFVHQKKKVSMDIVFKVKDFLERLLGVDNGQS